MCFAVYLLQLITEISKGNVFSQLPRILGVYPVISDNPQLSKFANTWKSYGSTKELQVQLHCKKIKTHFPEDYLQLSLKFKYCQLINHTLIIIIIIVRPY